MIQSNTRSKSYFGLTLTLLMLLAGAGCQSASPGSGRGGSQRPQVSQTSQWISVDQLASRLHMRVANQDVAMVTLKNDRNTVMLFKYDDGQFSVDGRMYGSVGHVLQDGTGFFWPKRCGNVLPAYFHYYGSWKCIKVSHFFMVSTGL